MKKLILAALFALSAIPAFAAEPTFLCVGTEPFWDLKIHPKGIKFNLAFEGKPVRLAAVQSKSAIGFSADYLRVYNTVSEKKEKITILVKGDKTCSDGMSDKAYSHEVFYINNASGQVFAGCCNVAK